MHAFSNCTNILNEVFDPCVATSCQYIPFPPADLDMVYVPDDKNRKETHWNTKLPTAIIMLSYCLLNVSLPSSSLSLLSELSIYNPRLPFSMKFPGSKFCADNGELLMIVGEISSKNTKNPLEIVFPRAGTTVSAWMFINNCLLKIGYPPRWIWPSW